MYCYTKDDILANHSVNSHEQPIFGILVQETIKLLNCAVSLYK